MKDEQKQEMVRLIKEAGECLKCGRTIRECKNDRLKKMMEKIAANAVCIGLYNFNRFIISNIGDGDFASIKLGWGSVINDFNRCMKIIDNEGENLKDILTPEEITEATNYTIFEQTGENED
jgi:hypothetical protein